MKKAHNKIISGPAALQHLVHQSGGLNYSSNLDSSTSGNYKISRLGTINHDHKPSSNNNSNNTSTMPSIGSSNRDQVMKAQIFSS